MGRLVQKELFKEISYGGRLKQFGLLTTVLAENAHLRAHVKDLHFFRTIGFDEDGAEYYTDYTDYSTDYVGSRDVLPQYPSLRSLSILDATPEEIQSVLGGPACSVLDNIRHLELKELVLSTDVLGDCTEGKIVFDESDLPRPLTSIRSLHLAPCVFRQRNTPLLDTLFPNLEDLMFDYTSNADIKHFLAGAPVGLRRLSLHHSTRNNTSPASLSLDRFARLEELSLWAIAAPLMFPALRTTNIQSLHFNFSTEVTDELLLGLVSGPTRMKHLASLRLDYMPTYRSDLLERLPSLLTQGQGYELDAVRQEIRPFWPRGCSASGLQKTIEIARSNGIKVYGRAVDILDWDRRLDDLAERYLVDHALTNNDFSLVERYLGRENVGPTIRRQRPLLAEILAGGK
ncbi:hypothetical protein JCM10908_002366 [Rhodotorula pacifica]|uniref:uncharacterized protein n=1 Tax=Rhodotorula pacifica TaxID=1495444 RepID=UPI0031779BDB